MIVPNKIQAQWEKLPAVSRYHVVREILSHEIITRKDMRDFFDPFNLMERTDYEIKILACQSPRGSLFHSILEGFGDWRLWTLKLEEIQEIAIYHRIHFRRKFAPKTGKLHEVAETLMHKQKSGGLGEFTEIVKYLREGKVDFRGLTAIWLKEDEIELIEGCHRMIGMCYLLINDEKDKLPPIIQIYVGKPYGEYSHS